MSYRPGVDKYKELLREFSLFNELKPSLDFLERYAIYYRLERKTQIISEMQRLRKEYEELSIFALLGEKNNPAMIVKEIYEKQGGDYE